ncbi:MAG: hypothetical protein ACPGU1_12515 [Myxococcota bacterium]
MNRPTPPPYPMSGPVRRALRAVIRASCPLESGPRVPQIVDKVEHQVRMLMQYMAPLTARGLCLVFLLVDWSQLWCLRGWRPLHRLSRRQSVKVVGALCRVRFQAVRQLMMAVRATVIAAYYDQPEVHFALGYHPRPWIRERLALRRRLMAGREATVEDQIPYAPPAVSA